jgi:hypothetical protein
MPRGVQGGEMFIKLRKATSKYRVALLGALVCLTVLGSCSGVGTDTGGGSDTDNADALSILRALGVSTVDNPPNLTTTNTQGEEVTIDDPDEWQPLKKTYTVYSPKAECALFGLSSEYHTTYYNSIFGLGSDVNYSEDNLITDDQSWEKTANKVACAADVDGDGLDEVVIFYIVSAKLYLRVYDYGTGKYSAALIVDDITPSTALTTTTAKNYAFDDTGVLAQYFYLCPADVDGDGEDELLLADYNTVYLLETDNSASAADVLESKTYDSAVTSLAAGDTDGDGADELLVCTRTDGFGYYDSSLDSPLSNPEMITYSSTGLLEACAGDFDGDSVDEFAITSTTGSQSLGGTSTVRVYETTVDTGAISLASSFTHAGLATGYYHGEPHAVDLDGDGCKDLYVGGYVFMEPLEAGQTHYKLKQAV